MCRREDFQLSDFDVFQEADKDKLNLSMSPGNFLESLIEEQHLNTAASESLAIGPHALLTVPSVMRDIMVSISAMTENGCLDGVSSSWVDIAQGIADASSF